MSDISDPHDRFFRELFSRPETGRDFLANYLPSHIAECLDLESLELSKGSFTDKELGKHFSDMLYKVRLKNSGFAYIYILLEHKSYPDHLVSFQLLRYMVRIWENLFKTDTKLKSLPPIIPIVIYHGKSEWKIAPEFHSLIDNFHNLEEFIPDFKYLLCNISDYSDDEIRGAVILRVGMLIFKYVFREELPERLPEILGLLRKLLTKRTGMEYLETILTYLVNATEKLTEEDLGKAVHSVLNLKGDDLMATLSEKWRKEGEKKGKMEGKIEGLLNGIELGLKLRFSSEGLKILPEIQKIQDIDILMAVHKGLETTKTLDELSQIYKK